MRAARRRRESLALGAAHRRPGERASARRHTATELARKSRSLEARRDRRGYSSTVSANARAKPIVVARPTYLPPCLYASGIIVSASIVRIAPPANASTKATVLGSAPSRRAYPASDARPQT